MDNMDKIANNIMAYACLALGVAALAGVIFYGAYWHLFTALGCTALFFTIKADTKKEEANKNNNR